ncbi:MAG TPA: glutathione S-transferase family protein [Kofleriaceae bacterium]|nr:glutathione S-transferase family protein [Kofleriaceae bacterium]
MHLELAYAPNTCALVPYVLLAEAGADFTPRPLDFRRREHLSPEFLALNPKHKVPVLIIDGEPLTESVAIGVWIARTFPAARLLPADPKEELRALSLMAWCASTIHPTLTPNALPQRYCDLPGSEESVRRCAQKLTHEHYAIGERLLAGRDFFFDHLTCPDVHFFWCFRRGMQFGMDVSAYPSCRAAFDRIAARPSVQRLLAHEASVLAAQQQAS